MERLCGDLQDADEFLPKNSLWHEKCRSGYTHNRSLHDLIIAKREKDE